MTLSPLFVAFLKISQKIPLKIPLQKSFYLDIIINNFNKRGKKMATVSISVSDELKERWDKVSKEYRISKSSMVVDILEKVLPLFEENDTKYILSNALRSIGNDISSLSNLLQEEKKEK